MKCCHCKRTIAAGIEAQKMVVEYRQSDGGSKVFGYMMPDGPLSRAVGQILRGYHHKCWHVVRKRENRGDAVTGRVLTGVPTGYEIGALALNADECAALGLTDEEVRQRGTSYLTERVNQLRGIAHRIGKAVGDATVLEAFWAEEHGGPYPHTHQMRLDGYQLLAHLEYAHGFCKGGRPSDMYGFHDELHAYAAALAVQAGRQDDPGHTETEETDWRQQLAADVEELT